MDISSQIRKLARSIYWLELYRASKDISSISLFNNSTNLSGLQSLLLYWLRTYDMLYTELAEKEWDNLDEKVIENDKRCDWFLCYRADQIKKKIKKHKDEMRKSSPKKNSLKIYQGAKNKGKA